MLFIHPLWQIAATLVAVYALVLALPRAASLHLGHKLAFKRPRHILAGKIALVGLLLGVVGGLVMARLTWGGWLITGAHGVVGLIMAPLMLFGLFSGLRLANTPRPRRLLPLLHGLNNLVLLALALYQFHLGDEVLDAFVKLG